MLRPRRGRGGVLSKLQQGGRTALLVINGADLLQKVDLDFGALLGAAGGSGVQYTVRNVWEGSDEPSPLANVSVELPPHDCAMFVLKTVGPLEEPD